LLLVRALASTQLDDLDLGARLKRRLLSLQATASRSTHRTADGDCDPLFHEAQATRHEAGKDA